MTSRPSEWRLPTWGAAILALLVASCTTSPSPTVSTALRPTTSTTVTTVTTAASTTTVPINAAVLLESALATYADGYRFSSVAIVNGAEVGSVEGIVIGDQSQVDIHSGDATVTYPVSY